LVAEWAKEVTGMAVMGGEEFFFGWAEVGINKDSIGVKKSYGGVSIHRKLLYLVEKCYKEEVWL
jgi:hypothetical protein